MTTPTTLAIEGELTIYRAAELRQAMLAALGQPGAGLEIDLAGVTELDSAGVQLLIAAGKSAAARGGALRLVRHSPAVLDAFAVLDLGAHFGDPINPPASH